MQLSDFFATLNLTNVAWFLCAFLTFDATGNWIATVLSFPRFLRVVDWIVGLGVFVFIWFILHFFLPYQFTPVLLSLLAMAAISLPPYVKNGGIFSLFKAWILFPFPVLVLLLVAKPLFLLLNLPPYLWDEMAYHFYSPARLATETSWPFLQPFSSNAWRLYDMLPRSMDSSFILMFALTKTYATARLLHLLIFVSAITAIGIFIKRNFTLTSAIVFSCLAILLNISLLSSATLGYIDAGSAAIAALFVITVGGFVLHRQRGYALAAATFLGWAIGTKYTTLGLAVAILVLTGIWFIFSFRQSIFQFWLDLRQKKWQPYRFLLLFPVLVIVFGGFWYVKNAAVTNNPIYPFFFTCRDNIPCGRSNDFFSGWADELSAENAEKIKKQLFQNKLELYSTLQLSLILAIIIGLVTPKHRRYLMIAGPGLATMVAGEIYLSQHISGFALRYFYHWLLLIAFGLSLPFYINWRASRFVYTVTLIATLIFGQRLYSITRPMIDHNRDVFDTNEYVTPWYRNYARQRASLTDWIAYNFPDMKDVIYWCGETRPMTPILVADPKIIWTSYQGLLRVFLVNCQQIMFPMIEPSQVEATMTEYLTKYPNAKIMSMDTCHPEQATAAADVTDAVLAQYYEINQQIICQRESTIPGLYEPIKIGSTTTSTR